MSSNGYFFMNIFRSFDNVTQTNLKVKESTNYSIFRSSNILSVKYGMLHVI